MKCPVCHREIGSNAICPYCGTNVQPYFNGTTTIVNPRSSTSRLVDLLKDIKLLLMIVIVILGGIFLLMLIEAGAQLF